jgi:hypothetical protein
LVILKTRYFWSNNYSYRVIGNRKVALRKKKGSTPNTNYKKGIFVTIQIKMMSFAYILGQKNERIFAYI